MKKQRRSIEIFNLSFLDVISCGFGAIILLLVLSRIAEPLVEERISRDLSGQVQTLSGELEEIRARSRSLRLEQARQLEALHREEQTLAAGQEHIRTLRGRLQSTRLELAAREKISRQLESARQSLSAEMRRLQAARQAPPVTDSPIGGIPVDSEYIIFIIDTSGSMQRYAWPLVRKKMNEILAVYPHVKGIQVMNDMGDYMFSQYAGRWIPDSPARRRAILRRLGSWSPFSNSSPVEGITRAIRRFHAPDKRISLYIFGDDFARGSIQAVLDTVARINRADARGTRRVRIHAIGFPVLLTQGGSRENAARFAALMRDLAADNNGSFVALSGLR